MFNISCHRLSLTAKLSSSRKLPRSFHKNKVPTCSSGKIRIFNPKLKFLLKNAFPSLRLPSGESKLGIVLSLMYSELALMPLPLFDLLTATLNFAHTNASYKCFSFVWSNWYTHISSVKLVISIFSRNMELLQWVHLHLCIPDIENSCSDSRDSSINAAFSFAGCSWLGFPF